MTESTLATRQACDELSRRLRAGLACRAEDFLAADSAIGLDSDTALELLYTEFIVREQLGQQPQVDDWLERFPQWRDELKQLFEVHAVVAQGATQRVGLSGTQSDEPSAAGPAGSRPAEFIGGYELLDEVGRGGMGVVYRARQRGLARIVALKMMLAPHNERERARFRSEAEATARLSHPNIVQIYEVGQEGDRPFLSMEFVAGQSLDKHLATSLLAPRAAADLLLTLTRAVAYAHQQGIVHRDLKPANILLKDEGGIPKITDFGLAKTITDDQAVAHSVAIVGTPSYMAPEQCRAGGRAGPTADVYALGAILYEALTGRPPFRGESALDILQQVSTQEPLPPSRLVPKISRDLETICLKCLAKQPQQRYPTASALADDLQRILAGEPILARPVGRTERVIRWCRRNPAIAALAGGIALALVTGTIISSSLAIWALNEKDRAAAHARQAGASAQQEQAARELAEYRFAQAEKAVEEYLDGIEKHPRLKEADFFDLRAELLTSAVPFYEEFVSQKPNDAALAAKRGRAYGRLGQIRNQLGDPQRAVADLEQMRSIFQKLATDFPNVADYRQHLARSHLGLGLLFYSLSKPEEALVEVRQAVTLQMDLVAGFPVNTEFRQDLARSRSTLGTVLDRLGSDEEAAAEYREVFALEQPLADRFPAKAAYRLDLARTHNNLAGVLYSLGKRAEAVDEMRQALQLREALAAEFPKEPAHRQDLANSHYNLALLFIRARQWKEAELEHRQALTLNQSLVDDFPSVPRYRSDLARAHYSFGRMLRDRSRLAEAEVEYREALALRLKLDAEVSGVPEYLADLAESHAGMASLYRAIGKRPEAIVELTQSIDIRRPLVEQRGDSRDHRVSIASHMNTLAVTLREEGRLDEARPMHAQAIEQGLAFWKEAPTNRNYSASLSGYYRELSETALLQKDHAAAGQAARQMAQVRPTVAGDAELAARFLSQCLTITQHDAQLSEEQRQSLVQSYADQAMEQLREAVRRGYSTPATLKSVAALAPLRDRPDFQQLVRELEAR